MLFYLGYSNKQVTEAELVNSAIWQGLDPEFARRLLAMMKELVNSGIPYGIGSSIRTTASQLNLFLTRHTQVASGGCCSYDGKRWALKAGYAHAAPPGSSYHEDCTPNAKCLAADMVGDHRAAERIMAKYGLLNFTNINKEPWHFQPSDIPTGRKLFKPATMWPLKTWPIAEDKPIVPDDKPIIPQEEEDMARIVRICEKDSKGEWQFTIPAQFVVTGGQMEWLTSLERRDAIIAAGHATLNSNTGAPYKLGRDQLKHYRLIGPLPPAEGGTTSTGITYAPLRADEFLK